MILVLTAEAVLLICLVYLAAELVLYSKKVKGTFVERVQRHKGKEGLSKRMQYAARVIYDYGEKHYNACSQDDISAAGPQMSGVEVTVYVNRKHPEKFLIRRNANFLWILVTAAVMALLLLFL